MKFRIFTLLAAIALALTFSATAVQAAGPGDGTCPNPYFNDSDGDGIPNGLDPDYTPPADGTGFQYQRRGGAGVVSQVQTRSTYQWREMWTRENLRLLIGTFGFGPGTGTGVCDGTGPKGFGGFGKR